MKTLFIVLMSMKIAVATEDLENPLLGSIKWTKEYTFDEYTVKRTPTTLILNDRMRVGPTLDMQTPNVFLSIQMGQQEFEQALASIDNEEAMNRIRKRYKSNKKGCCQLL